MITLPKYIEIKDNYCIAYFGHSKEYLLQLKLLRPFIEKEFPELNLFIACSDCYFDIIKDDKKAMKKGVFLLKKDNFSYIREIQSNSSVHPIEELILESNIPIQPIPVKNQEAEHSKQCSLMPFGNHPVKSLSHNQILEIEKFVANKGYELKINKDFENSSWIIGVESLELYNSAISGKRTTLIETGLGANLFKKLFPDTEILKW